MDNIQFLPSKQVKLSYMWRDQQRRVQLYCFEAFVSAPYPLNKFDLANKIAILDMKEDWYEYYNRATYKRSFISAFESDLEPIIT